MKTVNIILYSQIKRRCNGAFFFVTTYMQVAVRSAIGKTMYQPGVTMKIKNDVLVFGEYRIIILLRLNHADVRMRIVIS